MTLHALLVQALAAASPQLGAATPPEEPAPIALAEKPEQKRCFTCKKKLSLSDMTCSKCQNRHCMQHRQPELHTCPHDFKAEGQALLAKQNPRVMGAKLDKI